jgi:RimJ/RimL family protein N-acetyltransferase
VTAPVLQTERLRLRPHVLSDWEAIAAFYESEEARFVGGPLDRRRSWFGFGADVGSWGLLGFGCWAVEERATGALAGQVGLNRPPHFPEAEIGWLTFPAFRRRGYAREAARAARAFAYGTLGWATAVSYVDPDNAASIAVARALGCVEDAEAERFDAEDIVFRHPSPASLGGAA